MYAKERSATRRKEYKRTTDASEARRKREDNAFSIRRNKREESLQKRRNFGADTAPPPAGQDAIDLISQLPDFCQMIFSEDPALMLDGTIGLRKVLSIEQNPPIEDVIRANAIPRLIEFLRTPISVKHQFEAAWALTNIGSGNTDQTMELIHHGAVPEFVKLLNSNEPQVREQAVWALGNIAGDSPSCRDYVMQFPIMDLLLEFTRDRKRTSLVRNAVWTISNFARGKPAPPFHLVRSSLPDLARLLYATDEQILIDACWALSYLSDGDNIKIQAVMEAEVGLRVVELLLHPSVGVQTPALRVVGNIVTGDDLQTQCMINFQVLPRLKTLLLTSTKKGIRKEACWTISNITAGTAEQIEEVIKADLIPVLIEQLNSATAEFDIRKEAAWAIANATSSGTPDQIHYLVSEGCLPALCSLLDAPDSRIIAVALEGLGNLLEFGAKRRAHPSEVNEYVLILERCGGIDAIEQLEEHSNPVLYDKAVFLIERYCGVAEEDQGTLPERAGDGSSFGFGSGAATGDEKSFGGGGGYSW
eukprot:TRINITY_DN3314_c0_g1_i1.p1 TRINITY_DN3314_c0_g1~~TRINITY_DN3314_c0_g1_i1.p1  ORF type:complete len:532 (+),score=243.82 TRINITY_DN3314_c0_g1_i1:62-1657(+)